MDITTLGFEKHQDSNIKQTERSGVTNKMFYEQMSWLMNKFKVTMTGKPLFMALALSDLVNDNTQLECSALE